MDPLSLDDGLESLPLDVVLHDREDPLDRVVVRAVGGVEDPAQLEFLHHRLDLSAAVDAEAVHEERHLVEGELAPQSSQELDELGLVDGLVEVHHQVHPVLAGDRGHGGDAESAELLVVHLNRLALQRVLVRRDGGLGRHHLVHVEYPVPLSCEFVEVPLSLECLLMGLGPLGGIHKLGLANLLATDLVLSIQLAQAVDGEGLPWEPRLELTAALGEGLADPLAQSLLSNKVLFLLLGESWILLGFHRSLLGLLARGVPHRSIEFPGPLLVSKADLSHVEGALAHLEANGLEGKEPP